MSWASPADDVTVEEGDTDTAPFGHGHLRLPEHAGGRGRDRHGLP